MQLEGIIKNTHLISIDSRAIRKNDIFIAVRGRRFDGHNFVREAFKKGARCAVVSKDIRLPIGYKNRVVKVRDTLETLGEIAKAHRQRFRIPVIAITGTNGKTTTKDIVSFVLSADYRVLKNDASRNNLIGLALTLFQLDSTHQLAVLEMGMNHIGEIAELSKIASPQIGVVTNIGPSHLEFLGNLKNVFKAKTELVRNLPTNGVAILNADDIYLRSLRGLRCKKVYFSIRNPSHFRARNLFYKRDRWFFTLGNRHIFEFPFLGRHNIYNALAAIAVARQLDMKFSTIAERLRRFKRAPSGRLELKNIGGLYILDDTYNSNPLSMKCALETLKSFNTKRKRIVVSGDMLELGKEARPLHELMGRTIARLPIDFLITLGRLSKYTNSEAKKNGMRGLYHAKSHRCAADILKKIATKGDFVLIKGSRAMEMERVIERLK